MAMVASAVANHGVLMRPHITAQIVNADGVVLQTIEPRLYSTVMKPSTARLVGLMMENVVNDGTGTAAALVGIHVAGKTGTAQDCANLALIACQANQVWFIAFAPADNPKIAIAVTLEHQLNGFGGSIAAPIAKAVLEALLRDRERMRHREVAAGTVIDGRYRVISRVGSGGMAEVYCAEDTQLGRRVAVKLLHERFAQDDQFVERFRREASNAASLSHPNIVSVYDRGEWSGTYYIAMEFLDGRSLDSIVREEAPLAPERAIELTEQVLRAARFAHRRNVVHRDLKPHNVIIDDEGRVKVTDFGIARAGASEITQTGSIMGTARYLSPEQAQGQTVSPRSDLYAIGIMLYELLTGTVPFEGDSVVAIALRHLSEAPRPPSTIVPSISPNLDAIVMRALEKDPQRRFADADEFLAALEAERERLRREDGSAHRRASRRSRWRSRRRSALPLPPSYTTQAIGPLGPVTGAYGTAPAYWDPNSTGVIPPGAILLPPGRRDRGPIWPWALLASVIAAGAIVAAILLLAPAHKTVPNVLGLTRRWTPTRTSAPRAFHASPISVPSTAPQGIVIKQSPPRERSSRSAVRRS